MFRPVRRIVSGSTVTQPGGGRIGRPSRPTFAGLCPVVARPPALPALPASQMFVGATRYDVDEYKENKEDYEYGLKCDGGPAELCRVLTGARLSDSKTGIAAREVGLCMFLVEPVSGGRPSSLSRLKILRVGLVSFRGTLSRGWCWVLFLLGHVSDECLLLPWANS